MLVVSGINMFLNFLARSKFIFEINQEIIDDKKINDFKHSYFVQKICKYNYFILVVTWKKGKPPASKVIDFFVTNSDFLIPQSLKFNVVDLKQMKELIKQSMLEISKVHYPCKVV